MQFFSDDKSVISNVTVPSHLCGWDRLVHGGVITTMLDEIMSWSAIHLLKKIILTKSITVNFLKPIFIGEKLRVEGFVGEVMSDREASMEGVIIGEEGNLRARSNGTFSLLTPATARRLRIMDDAAIDSFEKMLQ